MLVDETYGAKCRLYVAYTALVIFRLSEKIIEHGHQNSPKCAIFGENKKKFKTFFG